MPLPGTSATAGSLGLANVQSRRDNVHGTVETTDVAKQLASFVKSILTVIEGLEQEINEVTFYEDTLRERVERDIKASACDKIIVIVNSPLE